MGGKLTKEEAKELVELSRKIAKKNGHVSTKKPHK